MFSVYGNGFNWSNVNSEIWIDLRSRTSYYAFTSYISQKRLLTHINSLILTQTILEFSIRVTAWNAGIVFSNSILWTDIAFSCGFPVSVVLSDRSLWQADPRSRSPTKCLQTRYKPVPHCPMHRRRDTDASINVWITGLMSKVFTYFPPIKEASLPFFCYWKVKNLVQVTITSL